MKKPLLFLFIALFSAATFVSAQQKQRVAVLPSVGDLDPQRLILLTDKVREIATKNLPIENFNILKQDVITRLIGEEELYRSCKEGVCIGDLAKKTDANYGARCDVIRLDNSLVLKFEIYSVNEESIFETFIDDDVKDFRGMFAVLETRLPDAFKKMVSVQNKALADAGDKAVEPQKQEAIAQQETAPAPIVQETTPIQPEYKAKYVRVDESDGKPRILKKKISVEAGGIFAPYKLSDYSSTIYRNYQVLDYCSSVGGYIDIDLIYAEILLDANIFNYYPTIDDLEYSPLGVGGLVVKYPVILGFVKVSPLLGFGGIWFPGLMFGGRVDAGISEIGYLRSEYLYVVDDGSSFKIGGGLDIGLGERKRIFWRLELMYRLIEYSVSYKDFGIKDDGYEIIFREYSVTTNSFELKAGIGYKWGGKKPK